MGDGSGGGRSFLAGKIYKEECDGAECEAKDHDGYGPEENTATSDAVDVVEGYEGEEEVCYGDGERGKRWGFETDEAEDCGGEVHQGVLGVC